VLMRRDGPQLLLERLHPASNRLGLTHALLLSAHSVPVGCAYPRAARSERPA
jgi:hypothetical protein